MIKAEIITIGDEILIGQIVDTNSAYIAEQLNNEGIKVCQITSVSDSEQHIIYALNLAAQQADVILITGGLGPTKDDITKKTLAKYFAATKMIIHEETLRYITDMFSKRNIPLTDLNIRQAEIPDNATAILNSCGTAPGTCFERDGKIYISMPGVPFEMKAMLPDAIKIIKTKFNDSDSIYHKSLLTYGIPESLLAEQIEDWEDALPNNMKLAYLPDINTGIKLRLSATGIDKKILQQQVEKEFSKIIPRLANAVYGYEPESLAGVAGKLLFSTNATLSVAESCTGGRIAHLISLVPGSSQYFKGGLVAYSNEIKINVLGVNQATIEQFGAVSRQTVEEMAAGVKSIFKTDFAIATSGIAGPTGGSDEKPLGLCWFAIASPHGLFSYCQQFTSDREGNITRASANALNYLRLLLCETAK